MTTASAPGKVILFGEHAVVYGEPAIAGAIDLRVRVKADKAPSLEIHSQTEDQRYVEKAVEVVLEHLGVSRGVALEISSNLPPSSGLGSSAAVSVATIAAVADLLGYELEKKVIAGLGYQVELQVQGAASPTDTYTSTYGGVHYIMPGRKGFAPIPIEAALPLVVGYTEMERSTKELVARVRKLRDAYPGLVTPIIKNIGRLTRQAKKKLGAGEDVGELMNINHGLLEALGVSNDVLSLLVHAARKAGARGAKLTGAGGGGCMIAYAPRRNAEVIKAIRDCGYTAFRAAISAEGVRLED